MNIEHVSNTYKEIHTKSLQHQNCHLRPQSIKNVKNSPKHPNCHLRPTHQKR